MKLLWTANIQVVVEAENYDEACDAVSEGMRNNGMIDWGYTNPPKDPRLISLDSDTYEEGDIFNIWLDKEKANGPNG